MKNGLIVATMLPVTIGHKFLIDFALDYLSAYNGRLTLMMYSRSFEPLAGTVRYKALCEHYEEYIRRDMLDIVHISDDDVPQNPSEDPGDFWDNWKERIRTNSENKPGDFLFASELYAIELAKVLECEFVPCNRYRETVNISGTKVRQDPVENFQYLLPELQKHFRQTVTIFGAESCGKTTMTRLLAKYLNGHLAPEWAREYLETVGSEVTDERMNAIVHGQYANQLAVHRMTNKPFVFQDTDLLSTLGYYKLWKNKWPELVEQLFEKTRSDLYIVMNDKIPFEPDPLRYGDGVRESAVSFWTDLLDQFNCKYHTIEAVDRDEQLTEAMQVCINLFMSHANMHSFVRT